MKKYIPWLLILVSFVYYSALSAKEFTWIFVSADAGDWLAASQMWFVPQPLGSPLFILLGHFLNLFPGDLVIKMTILLSCLPAAITVGLVYVIARKLVGRLDIALVCSLVTLGATIMLTQATILEEYAITMMFLTLAYWLYLRENRMLTGLVLGLGTAIHIIVLPIALLWLVVERKRWREYVRPMGIYVGIVAGFYSIILIIMASNAPPYIAGYLNLESLIIYLTATAGVIVGTGSIFDLPSLTFRTMGMLVVSLGLAIIPLSYALSRRMERKVWVLIATVAFLLWYHITNLDPSTWTFLSLAIPSLAILAGLGLTKLNKKHLQAVVASALVLVIANGFLMNASVIAQEHPEARETLTTYMDLPRDSALILLCGHYSLAAFYAHSLGRKDLVPTMYGTPEMGICKDYEGWLAEEHGVKGNTTTLWVESLLEQGRNVYIVGEEWRYENTGSKLWMEFQDNFFFHGPDELWMKEVTWKP